MQTILTPHTLVEDEPDRPLTCPQDRCPDTHRYRALPNGIVEHFTPVLFGPVCPIRSIAFSWSDLANATITISWQGLC